jgi:ABC-type sugar transport system ATPase subunit
MILEVKDLSYAVEQKQVLQNINLNVKQGEITAVLGANGSGKSTLLRLLAGLLDPDAGEIFFDSKKVLGPSHRLLPGHPGISLVKQDNRLLPFHTVRQNLRQVLQFYNEAYKDEKIEELTALLGLGKNLDRQLKFLSGGEQQRVSIAAALAADPQLLLMDEPFSQTDLNLKEQMKKYLSEIVDQLHISLLFVTHNAEDALSLSDHIIVLNDGGIVEEGNSHDLYYRPKEIITAELTGYCNWIPLDTPGFSHLNIIGNAYFSRPEQISIQTNSAKNHKKGTITKIEFCGFYQCIYLMIEELNVELMTIQAPSSKGLSVGKEVWVKI